MTITIVGHGYVGLVSACCFADFGNDVYVIGHTDEKLKRLRSGDPIIYEPGLKELLEKNNSNPVWFVLRDKNFERTIYSTSALDEVYSKEDVINFQIQNIVDNSFKEISCVSVNLDCLP